MKNSELALLLAAIWLSPVTPDGYNIGAGAMFLVLWGVSIWLEVKK